jgi:phosphoglycolate phosphatase-like HAD superfamily hydrolase
MTVHRTYTQQDLIDLKPRHATFVGIDSDGCVFDTMEIKQKQCFHTVTVRLWKLEKIEKEAREVLEFVNLYSKWRGTNRFPAQVMAFEMLRQRPEVKAAGVEVPALTSLKAWVDSGAALANSELEKAVKASGDPDLALALRWSKETNDVIARTVKNVPPFKWAAEGLRLIHQHSDAICVSQTPHEALVREWSEHGLLDLVSAVAGQELGTKADHLRLAAGGKYPTDRILKIGDALGDLKAARANHVLFYPICPQHEEESWERFCKEAYDRFLNRTYAGDYERGLVEAFDKLLPETPPWKR